MEDSQTHEATTSKEFELIMEEGHQRLMPYLIVQDAAGLITFLETVFEGEVTLKVEREDGEGIMHAEVMLDDETTIMVANATSEYSSTPGGLFLYVPDTAATFKKAVDAGAIPLQQPSKMDYADLAAGIRDPFGNTWWIATNHTHQSPTS